MGRVYKRKRRSCSLCKPHKTGHAPRFTKKEMAKRKQMLKDIEKGIIYDSA